MLKLGKLPRAIGRGLINSMNRTNTAGRRFTTDYIASSTGIKKKTVRGRLAIRRAKTRLPAARMVPSSQGVEIHEYRYRLERVGYGRNKTRGRIRVNWVGNTTKIAAGFINPLGNKQAPLRTRSYKGKFAKPRAAVGPSVAAAWKAMPKQPVTIHTRDVLLANIQKDIPKQIGRAVR